MKLTPAQLTARAALVKDFRNAITAAMWEVIEAADPELLAADDGTPYSSCVTESLRTSSLDQMVSRATNAACKALEGWL